MTHQTFAEFEAAALRGGFDEVLERTWTPGQVVAEHDHPFDASALVVHGTMWLTVAGETRRLVAGDTFVLDAGVPHDERYGDEGATYWVARRAAAVEKSHA